MLKIVDEPIDYIAVVEAARDPRAGAVCLFLGTVREITGDKVTTRLEYEAYPEMALKCMARLEAEARARWPLLGVAMVHRVGRLELGEVSVAIAVSSPHRPEAFEAGRWLIDAFKRDVPVWKREIWADGSEEWVHPAPESETRDEPEPEPEPAPATGERP